MRVLAIALLAACSSHPPHTGGGSGPAPDAAPTPPRSADGGAAASLREGDCDALIGHVVDVGLAEMRVRKPADEVPTDEQVTKLRAKLRAEMMDMCLAWDRASYDCMMAAKDSAGLNACASQPPEH